MFKSHLLTLSCLITLFLLLTGCGSDISKVQNLYLEGIDGSITFGQAMDSYPYFSSTKWESFEDNKGRKVVQVTATVEDNAGLTKEEVEAGFEYAVTNLSVIFQFVQLGTGDWTPNYIGASSYAMRCKKQIDYEGAAEWINHLYNDSPQLVINAAGSGDINCHFFHGGR